MFFKDDRNIYRVAAFDRLKWLEHGFGTRHTTAWNGAPNLVTLRQIHSGICVEADGRTGCIGEGDALLTSVPGALLSIRTADCLPILIVDGRHRAVAAVHSGWRGAVRRIAAKAVAAMEGRFSSRPEELQVAIGPGIGPCCYEVGPEVAAQFQDLFPERSDLGARAHINLVEAIRRQLLEAGVAAERTYAAGHCTGCEAADFHSWRRERQRTGRMLSVIGIKM